MLSAEASNAKTPLAPRRHASDDLEVLGEAFDELEDVIGVGVDVATAFTPPITGPLSTAYITGNTPLTWCGAFEIWSDARLLHLCQWPSQRTRTRQGNLVQWPGH